MTCNCKTNWKERCEPNKLGLKYCENLDCIPALYVIPFNEYTLQGIISQRKNDDLLYDYLNKNNYIEDELCYLYIAIQIFDDIERRGRRYETTIETDVKFLIDYLVWTFGSPLDKNNYIKERVTNEKNKTIKNKYKLGIVKQRTGQDEFRKDLIKIHEKCQICGITNKSMLVASHIKTYHESNDNEAMDFYNGFLLCKMHDGLFDKGLITFDNKGNVLISEELNDNDRDILKVENIKIELEPEQKKYINWHRDNIFKK
ncbi:HNH endonuclease [Clostridium botulinum]|uniref:HNH endonuclease n=1 Tax=Clostridium botulinum TaxID=1491 RepID=A0A6M0SLG9_CLOBO|nr:HNH endonuclease [Clostridium botulinum]NFA42110.1 HNH endonuclease [Clostridium botulinum]